MCTSSRSRRNVPSWMPAILAQVHGDAVGAAEVCFDRRPHGVGFVRALAPGAAWPRGRC